MESDNDLLLIRLLGHPSPKSHPACTECLALEIPRVNIWKSSVKIRQVLDPDTVYNDVSLSVLQYVAEEDGMLISFIV